MNLEQTPHERRAGKITKAVKYLRAGLRPAIVSADLAIGESKMKELVKETIKRSITGPPRSLPPLLKRKSHRREATLFLHTSVAYMKAHRCSIDDIVSSLDRIIEIYGLYEQDSTLDPGRKIIEINDAHLLIKSIPTHELILDSCSTQDCPNLVIYHQKTEARPKSCPFCK